MSTITALVGTDGITTANSMTKINTNFSNLNSDKIETSYIDTDTALTANSDSKIATQKAVKTYVDAGGNVNASVTAKGIVEIATSAEIMAGTATGATGAVLAVAPDQLRAVTTPVIRQYLTAASPATWTKPTGLRYIIVEVQAAGGAGANSDGSNGGGGGGSGTYGKKVISAASLGTTETVTIGAANVSTGNSSFGSHLTCGNGVNSGGATGGAAGGAASGADFTIPGEAGITAIATNKAGPGASSFMGKGGQAFSVYSTGDSRDGIAGSGYGAGGGGGAGATDGSPTGAGASGTAGIVIVTEYYL